MKWLDVLIVLGIYLAVVGGTYVLCTYVAKHASIDKPDL